MCTYEENHQMGYNEHRALSISISLSALFVKPLNDNVLLRMIVQLNTLCFILRSSFRFLCAFFVKKRFSFEHIAHKLWFLKRIRLYVYVHRVLHTLDACISGIYWFSHIVVAVDVIDIDIFVSWWSCSCSCNCLCVTVIAFPPDSRIEMFNEIWFTVNKH